MNRPRAERIRRAAILVASLDEALAERILAALPPQEAAQVLDEAGRLETIDPEEQQDVVAEFRRMSRGARGEGPTVEFAFSDAASAAQTNDSPRETEANRSGSAADGAFGDADALAAAELLSVEQPQTIAATLSRLGHDAAAEVFAALPVELQAEVLDRLANLQTADEDAVQEIESHLQRRIVQHRQHRERAAAGAELARQILAKTPETRRNALLAQLGLSTSEGPVAMKISREAADRFTRRGKAPAPVAQQAAGLATAVRQAQRGYAAESAPAGESVPYATPADPHGSLENGSLEYDAPIVLDDRSAELESLSNDALYGALRIADEQLVQRSLAASSERFVKRVSKMLRRRDAKRLRQLLRTLGPTRIADLRSSQYEFLTIARACETATAGRR